MTAIAESGAVTRTDLTISVTVPPVAQGLMSAFDANPTLLQQMAAKLFDGEVQLKQRRVQLAPFIGPAPQQMQILHALARSDGKVAQEVRDIMLFHKPERLDPLAQFLLQFPVSWRAILLSAIRDDVIGIELKAGRDNRVVDIVVDHAGDLFEYSLRAFKLTFEELQTVVAWMRKNEDRLPRRQVILPRLRKDDNKAPAQRYAELMDFFKDFPEQLRHLLAQNARPRLIRISFEETPMGDLVLRVSSK